MWNKGLTFAPALPIWLPVHVALVTWGWLWNLALGAAFWILPRFGRSRPHAWLAWLGLRLPQCQPSGHRSDAAGARALAFGRGRIWCSSWPPWLSPFTGLAAGVKPAGR